MAVKWSYGVRVCQTPREGKGAGWGQSYTFDGFGNLKQVTAIKGSVPTLNVSYNAATNRRTSDCADANGNLNGATAPTCLIPDRTYDVANRLTTVSSAAATYAYTPGNQRLYKKVGSDEELTFWGANGQKLVSYELVVSGSNLRAQNARIFKYFGGRLIYDSDQFLTNGFVYTDRLGSTVKTYPFGQERPSATSNDEQKFATYYRDAESGLDYAMNRYHSAGDGRFLSPDPSRLGVNLADPGSWNKYAYVGGDPINNTDPSGLFIGGVPPGAQYAYCWDNPEDPECLSIGLGCGILYECPTSPPEPEGPELDWETRENIHYLIANGEILDNTWSYGWYTDGSARVQFSLAPGETIGLMLARLCVANPAACVITAGTAIVTYSLLQDIVDSAREQRQIGDAIAQALRDCKNEGKEVKRSPADARRAVGDAIHRRKSRLGRRGDENFSFRELVKIAKETLCP